MSITSNKFYTDDQSADRVESTFLPEGWMEVDADGQMFIHLAPSGTHPEGMVDLTTGEMLYRTLGALGLFTLGRTDQDGSQKHFGESVSQDPTVALDSWHLYSLGILGGPGEVGATEPTWTGVPAGKYKEIADFIAAW